MAASASIPVVNGLSDFSHPCQALADVFTIKEKLGKLTGITVAYIGDGNNVCNSLISACAKLHLKINVATPKGFGPDKSVVKEAMAAVNLFDEPQAAAEDADVLYTDVWTSMGQEKEAAKRKKIFKNFQVNKKLLQFAKKNALVMHCLPAHRGQEIAADVLESKNSVVFDQAENRMHVQKAILIKLLVNSNR
jgi:ornithine carbamoyltransferase